MANRDTPDASSVGVAPIAIPDRRSFYPVDTLVKVADAPQTNDLLQLAQGLSQFNPSLNRFLAQTTQAQSEADAQSAKDQAIKTGLTYQQAVQQGIVSPDQSGYFMNGWKEIDGQNAATTAVGNMQTQWQTDGKAGMSSDQFNNWFQQQASSVTQNADPATLSGMAPVLQRAKAALWDTQSKQNGQNAWNGMQDAFGTQVGNTIDQYRQQVKQSGGSFDPQQAAQMIYGTPAGTDGTGGSQGITGLPKFVGMDTKTVDSLVANAVQAKAVQYRDPDILQTLNQNRPDSKNPGAMLPGFGTTAEGATTVQNVSNSIFRLTQQDNAEAHQQLELQRSEATRTAEKTAQTEMQQTGTISSGTLSNIAANPDVDPSAFSALQGIQSQRLSLVREGREVADYTAPDKLAQLEYHIREGSYGQNADGSPMTASQWTMNQFGPGGVRASSNVVQSMMGIASSVDACLSG